MCGIVGYQGRFSPDLLDAMVRAVAHRGPDGEGCVRIPGDGSGVAVGLGHRRLAIIDLSDAGRQPMSACCERCGATATQDLLLTYNGEIYNFAEIRRELAAQGHAFHTQTDSEILLHLYAESGLTMLSRLNGIFAFAIYDGRSRGRPQGVERGDVFLARDQLGVKPLYIAETPRGVLFASEIKALRRSADVSRDIDPVAIHQTLAYLWTPAPRTALKGVRKLPPGFAALLRGGRVARQWQHYDLPVPANVASWSEADAADRVRSTIREAVHRQMVSDVPVGAFLSGGLDSSAVVAMMRHAEPEAPIRCYSIGFKDGVDLDGSPADLPYARQVARQLNVDLETIEIGADIIGRLEEMLRIIEEPQADPAPLNALVIAEHARRDGIKVLLSGAGGDDLFTGYRRHSALLAERYWRWVPASMRRGIASRARRWASEGTVGSIARRNAVRRLTKAATYADLDDTARLISYFWWSPEELRRPLYSGDLAAQLASQSVATPFLDSLSALPQTADPISRMLYLELKHFLPDHNLNYTDKTGMAYGVEVRVPLLDLEVVRLAWQLPSGLKQRGTTGKYIFRRAMESELPRDVIDRRKSGFGAPLRQWMRGELRAYMSEMLSPSSLRKRGLFDATAVQRLLALNESGRVDASYTLFGLLCIELWCRLFVDDDGEATLS